MARRSSAAGRRGRPTRQRSQAELEDIRRARARQIASKRAAETRRLKEHRRPKPTSPPFDGGVHTWYYLIRPRGQDGIDRWIYVAAAVELTDAEIDRRVRRFLEDQGDYGFALAFWGFDAIYHR